MDCRRQFRLLLPIGCLALCGCGDSRPSAPLVSSTFIGPAAKPATAPAAPAAPATRPSTAKAPATVPATGLAAPKPPEHPESIPVMLAPGQYQTIGGVVSEVNGHPIYANKVMRQLRGELSARAPEMDAAQYKAFATDEIHKKVESLERDELIFGAADRYLEGEDRQLAEALTMQYRTKKITDAGGSVELAKQKAAVDGDNFDELVYDQYRRYMTEVYYRKKVYPRVQISADDMRHYYNANATREFTELPEVTFRLIKVDTRQAGGKDRAKARAQEIAAKAATGDFTDLARTMNDDARLARSGGLEAPIQKGAYRLEKVEASLWTTPVGQATPVIEDSGNFYIAKVESRKDGKTRSFEDQAVQDQIRWKDLWPRQFRKLADDIEQNLRKNSMVRKNDDSSIIEMAMQGYAIWAKPQTAQATPTAPRNPAP